MLNKIYMYVKTYHKLKFKSILKMLYQLNGVLESKKKHLDFSFILFCYKSFSKKK